MLSVVARTYRGPVTRGWDAASYDRVGGPMTAMAAEVLDRVPLLGTEVVLDAGCGTGRVTELLLDRLPHGRVVAADADPDMVRVARANLGDRAKVLLVDLLQLRLDDPVDVVFSTATFHWVLDHERLFARLYDALRPGGHLVAQCGGRGNISELRRVADEVATEVPFSAWFETWEPSWFYAGPEETAQRLSAAGFGHVRTWLVPHPVVPDDPAEYLSTVTLGTHVQRLPDPLRAPFVELVMRRLTSPVTVDYVRLNIDARRPERTD